MLKPGRPVPSGRGQDCRRAISAPTTSTPPPRRGKHPPYNGASGNADTGYGDSGYGDAAQAGFTQQGAAQPGGYGGAAQYPAQPGESLPSYGTGPQPSFGYQSPAGQQSYGDGQASSQAYGASGQVGGERGTGQQDAGQAGFMYQGASAGGTVAPETSHGDGTGPQSAARYRDQVAYGQPRPLRRRRSRMTPRRTRRGRRRPRRGTETLTPLRVTASRGTRERVTTSAPMTSKLRGPSPGGAGPIEP